MKAVSVALSNTTAKFNSPTSKLLRNGISGYDTHDKVLQPSKSNKARLNDKHS